MALQTCFLSMLALTKMDNKDICTHLEKNGFNLDYRYMTNTTEKGIEFTQFLDRGSRLSLQNPNVDYHALARHRMAA